MTEVVTTAEIQIVPPLTGASGADFSTRAQSPDVFGILDTGEQVVAEFKFLGGSTASQKSPIPDDIDAFMASVLAEEYEDDFHDRIEREAWGS